MNTLKAKHTGDNTCTIYIPSLSFLEGIEDEQMNKFVLDSISKEGLMEPLTVWRCTREEWIEWAKGRKGIKQIPEGAEEEGTVLFMVRTGNNRLRAAMTLGYDAIQCDLFSTIEEAEAHAKASKKRSMSWREPYKRKFK